MEMENEHLTNSFSLAQKRAMTLLAYNMPFEKVCEEINTTYNDREFSYFVVIAAKMELRQLTV